MRNAKSPLDKFKLFYEEYIPRRKDNNAPYKNPTNKQIMEYYIRNRHDNNIVVRRHSILS